MESNYILHILDGSHRSRADQARLGYELGYHCEIYANIEELKERPPNRGIVLARDDSEWGSAADVLAFLHGIGVWLPVVGTSDESRPGQVVAAVKAGAFDYLRLPLTKERLQEAVVRIDQEAKAYGEARRKIIEARSRIANLSPREREVLEWLAEGRSNKMIARELDISPRTVEIHRANMMGKLGANHAAEAVRLRLEAYMDANQISRMG
jgi:FixJ family two-component response regulator